MLISTSVWMPSFEFLWLGGALVLHAIKPKQLCKIQLHMSPNRAVFRSAWHHEQLVIILLPDHSFVVELRCSFGIASVVSLLACSVCLRTVRIDVRCGSTAFCFGMHCLCFGMHCPVGH